MQVPLHARTTRWKLLRWVASTLVVMFLASLPIAATGQDEPEAQEPAKKPAAAVAVTSPDTAQAPQESMFVWVYNAEGIFFFPQLFISIVVVTMIVWYSVEMRTSNFIPPGFLQQFENLFKEKKFQEAYELARKDESFLGKMVSAGIGRLSVGYQQAIEATQEVADDESMKHEHRLSYLAMIANLATLVGLLGTVWGMVASFMVIARSDTAPKPSELATGVSQALVTTILGLLQAIPATLAFTILKNRSARLAFEAGMACEQIMSRFAAVTKRPTAAAPGASVQAPAAGS